ncbi:uncharacterized protein LOC135074796 [Ostrinia nubilalis]|uniref:uncharacterized protein LOC135074796 n=1 Tax=Ostrinia nubilalis TaxID=29057 RepID=UPI00308237BA
MIQLLLLAAVAASCLAEDLPPSCEKPVYCDSELLHHVQTSSVFPDSKTFVDLHMLADPETILEEFDQLLNETNNNPTKEQLQRFVESNFDSEGELEDWTPNDFSDNPKFLLGIRDEELRQYAKDIHNIWPTLGRRIKSAVFEKPERFSLIPVPNGFIIPGGRFKEIYYWDTYWIIEGLLIGGMNETARGMIENLIELLRKVGHIPNGSRWYYQERSQPPLLSAMMSLYIRETKDIKFLKDNIDALQEELNYWLDSQIITFDKGNSTHTLLRYYAPSKGPRPESYREDYNGALRYTADERKQEFYIDLKSAAESGWDFSSRWFIGDDGKNGGNLTNIHTQDIIPVDLNAIFANALQNMAYFEGILKRPRRGSHWAYLAQQWRSNIEAVFWNEEDGVWYDYDMVHGTHRKYFYPSNVAPLWMGAVDKKLVVKHSARVLEYLEKSHGLDFPGGVPSSLIRSGEQWDFPNAWPPLVSIVVNALEALGSEEGKKVAFDVAQTWVRACRKGFVENKQMFEKYDAEQPGKVGGGGEYVVQFGFGWSNGVVLEFLTKYGRQMTATDATSYSTPHEIESKENVYTIDTKESRRNMLKLRRLRSVPLYPVLGLLGAYAHAFSTAPACNSSIFCTGELLHTVQLARVFPDSKTFVDLKLVQDENVTLADFTRLMQETQRNPTREQLTDFVNNHFSEGDELMHWMPPDFDPDPPFLKQIIDPKLKQFAKSVIGIWAKLGRKVDPAVAKNPDKYSFLYVPNGFIVPGGRFKELYYWDSFWVVRGLLISNMTQTAKGMIENLLYLVEKLGYIPNGSRIYYLGRSQPPLLAAMVASYFTATGDLAWLEQHLPTVEKELQYWLDKKKVTVKVNGKKYVLLRYFADPTGTGPRPESYYEDYRSGLELPKDEREDFYNEMKSAAESGWDFSSRWFVTAGDIIGNLTDVHATRILPVDLNAIFANALELAGDFRNRLKDRREAQKWWSLAKYWRSAIENVMWDPVDGVWYDYDAQARAPRKHFYPSCATPLWAGTIEKADGAFYGAKLVKYLLASGGMNFPGGIPASVLYSGEQWDYPNAWPPLQSILIGGLDASGNLEAEELAKKQAKLWIRANYIGYSTWQKMFEKYSAENPGHEGSGGEYVVQDGFGWTNGVALELLQRYSKDLVLDEQAQSTEPYVSQIR